MAESKLIERKGFRVKICRSAADGNVDVTVEGKIHEDFDGAADEVLSCLAGFPKATVEFHLGDVTSINSIGIRRWILFLEELEESHKICFFEIGEVFTEAAILIPNLLGGPSSRVISLRLPYHCAHCARDFALKWTVPETLGTAATFTAPLWKCPSCDRDLVFGAEEEEYATLLNSRLIRE